MDKREVLTLIQEKIQEAQHLVWEAEALADEHKVPFSMNLGSYGMGGYYDPDNQQDEWGNDNGGWHASSQSC